MSIFQSESLIYSIKKNLLTLLLHKCRGNNASVAKSLLITHIFLLSCQLPFQFSFRGAPLVANCFGIVNPICDFPHTCAAFCIC